MVFNGIQKYSMAKPEMDVPTGILSFTLLCKRSMCTTSAHAWWYSYFRRDQTTFAEFIMPLVLFSSDVMMRHYRSSNFFLIFTQPNVPTFSGRADAIFFCSLSIQFILCLYIQGTLHWWICQKLQPCLCYDAEMMWWFFFWIINCFATTLVCWKSMAALNYLCWREGAEG